MFYWCHLSSPPNVLIMAPGRRWTCTDCERKGNKNKEVGSNLWRWSYLSPLFATGGVSSEAKANFIKTWGMGCVRLSVKCTLYHYRLHQCFRERSGWSIHSSAGAHTKTGYLAEWNQIGCTWFIRWNHRGWEPCWFKARPVIGVRASASLIYFLPLTLLSLSSQHSGEQCKVDWKGAALRTWLYLFSPAALCSHL